MESTNNENSSSFELVFVVEATSNLAAHWDGLKKHYINPIVKHFHKQSVTNSDLLASLSGNLYGLVLFYAADRAPDSLAECYAPVKNHTKFLKLLDTVDFNGGGAEHHSHIAEGLATAAQLYKDMTLQQRKSKVERFCFLVTNTPPYELPVVESILFSGLNYQELTTKFKDLNIKISVLCPHLIKELKNLFVVANDVKPPVMNYAQDKRHLVLVSGFHISLEKEPQPLSEAPPRNIAPVKTEPATTQNVTTAMPVPISETPSVVSIKSEASFSSSIAPQSTVSTTFSSGTMYSNSDSINTPIQSKSQINATSTSLQDASQASSSNTNSFFTEKKPLTLNANPSNSRLVDLPRSSTVAMSLPSKPEQKPTGLNFELAKKEAQKVLEIATNQEFEKLGPNTEVIWSGTLEWTDKRRAPASTKVTHSIPCQIAENISNPSTLSRLNASSWSSKLSIQLIPQTIISQTSQLHAYLKANRQFVLSFPSHQVQQMANMFLQKNLFGLIQHLTPQPNDGKVIAVFYRRKEDKGSFYGLIPNDSVGFLNMLKVVIQNVQRHRQAAALAQGNQSMGQNVSQTSNLNVSEQNVKTGLQPFRNHEQQFHNTSFQQSDMNTQNNPQLQQSQQLNPGLSNMKSINVSISTQPSMNIRTQTGQTILQQPSSNVINPNRGMVSNEGNVQLRGNQASISGNIVNQGSNFGSAIQIQGGARQQVIRVINNQGASVIAGNRPIAQNPTQQLRPMGPSVISGNRPINQNLRSLLGANNMQNANIQNSNIRMRQQDNAGLRSTATNNMQQQNYIRSNNMMSGMQNQRNF